MLHATKNKLLSWILIILLIAEAFNPLVTVLAEPADPAHIHIDACFAGHNHTANYCYQMPHVHQTMQCPYTTEQIICGLPTQAGYAYERDWGSGYIWCGSPVCQRYAQNNNGLKNRAIDIPYTCTTCHVTQTFRYTCCVFKNGTVVTHDDARSNYTTCKQTRNVIRYSCPIPEGTVVWNCGKAEEDTNPRCHEVVTALNPEKIDHAEVPMGTAVSELNKAKVRFLDGSSREEAVLVSGYQPDQPGTQELTFSYGVFQDTAKQQGPKTAYLSIQVTKQVKGIRASYTGRTKIEGQTISPDDLQVQVVYTDDSTEEIGGYELSGTDLNLGKNKITITWKGQETTVIIEAVPKTICGIRSFYHGGSKELGTVLDEKDTEVFVQYDNGTEETVSGYTYDPSQVQRVGDQTVAIWYQGFSSQILVPGYCNWDQEGYEQTIEDLNQKIGSMAQQMQQIRSLLGNQEPITGISQLLDRMQKLEVDQQQGQMLLAKKNAQYQELWDKYEELNDSKNEPQNGYEANQSLLQSCQNQIRQLQAQLWQVYEKLGNQPVLTIENMEKEILVLEEKRKELEESLSYSNHQYKELADENTNLREELKNNSKNSQSIPSAGTSSGFFDLVVAGDDKLTDILNLTIQMDKNQTKTYYTNEKVKEGWGISSTRYPKKYETDLSKLAGNGRQVRFYAKHKEGTITYLCQLDQVVLQQELPKIRVLDKDIGQTTVYSATKYQFKSHKITIPIEITVAKDPKNLPVLEYQIVEAGYDYNPAGSWKKVKNNCIVIKKPTMARVYIKATDIYGNQQIIKTKGFVVAPGKKQ